MSDATPTRRSGRKRRINSKYAGVDWDREALRRIRAHSTSSGSSPSNSDINQDPSEDDDFDASAIPGPVDISSDNATSSVASETDAGEYEVSEKEGVGRHRSQEPPTSNNQRVPNSSKAGVSRGLREAPYKSRGPSVLLPLIHGHEEADMAPVNHSRSTWLRGRDATLPSRSTLASPESSFAYLVEQDLDGAKVAGAVPDISRNQATQLASRQSVKDIDRDIAIEKRFLNSAQPHSVVSGPFHAQRSYTLDPCQAHTLRTDADPSKSDGWLLNLGEKVQAVSWAPKSGDTQFLAVVARCTPSQRDMTGSSIPRSFGPAFTPSASYPTSIHIWAFHARSSTDHDLLHLDGDTMPELVQVIGLYSGDIRDIHWAPTDQIMVDNQHPFLLGVLSSDSHLRVLAIELSTPPTATRYVVVEAPVVDIPPPTNPTTGLIITGEDPVFSTFCWLSSHELALGTSNGLTLSYDILEELQHPPTSTSVRLTPYQTLHTQHTYITALAPATPLLPNTHRLLASSSAGGDLALTSLLPSHPASTMSNHRSRLPSSLLTYSPYTRSFLTVYPATHIRSNDNPSTPTTHPETDTAFAESANGSSTSSSTLCVHHIRRFSTLLQLARLPLEGGAATALAAGSVHHPCILVGTAGGDVWGTNYLRRCFVFRGRMDGKGGWCLRVVRADWREESARGGDTTESSNKAVSRDAGEDSNAKAGKNLYHGRPTRTGMTRLVFGWKATPVDFATKAAKHNKSARKGKDGVVTLSLGKKMSERFEKAESPKTEGDMAAVEDINVDDEMHLEADGKSRSARNGMGVDADGDINMISSETNAGKSPTSTTQERLENEDDQTPRQITAESNFQRVNKRKQTTKKTTAYGSPETKSFKAVTETIFEEEQAVTTLAWSKDRRTAGWAAVGWGSGLVMVRDLSV